LELFHGKTSAIKKLNEEKKELVKETKRVGLKGLRANIKRRGGLVARNHQITPSIN
jgi:hypothetical protein